VKLAKLRAYLPPYLLPILFFAGVILLGATLLHLPASHATEPLSWIDAIFTATSATCVTGLVVVDTGSYFSHFGQAVIISLIQLGGLGIMTFTSLFFYLWRQRVSLTDRLAVGQTLLHDPAFHLGKFLIRIFAWTLIIEAAGAFLIMSLAPDDFPFFSAIFHAISAFCNAGFALQADSLMRWQGDLGINLVFMALIILGGIGFSVLVELQSYAVGRANGTGRWRKKKLSWYAKVVLKTTAFLIVAGWVLIYFAEFMRMNNSPSYDGTAVISALFQSVTCRTAGFNSMDIGRMTNVSLLVMIVLMFIGGAPGSCAGGIKVTTFRAITAFIMAQMRGRQQAVVGKWFAINRGALNKALILVVFAVAIIFTSSLLLDITEGWGVPHSQARGLYLDILFETVSAFGTVGLSTGLTPNLSFAGKCIIIMLMFVGRLGPIIFLASIQSVQKKEYFTWPEEDMLIG